MARNWTEEQKAVIDSRGHNLLVSAAAGSGKTAVLVERIIQRVLDKEDPVSIDHMLVVTFTNAAATEMRERIREALEKRLEEDPANAYLQEQAALVHQAMIMTIHSFCAEVARTHFHKIDVDPAFAIAEETQTVFMQEEALSAVLEEAFEEGSEAFMIFADTYATGRDDAKLDQVIMDLYRYSMAYPDPYAWRKEALAVYQVRTVEEMHKSAWYQTMLQDVRTSLARMLQDLKEALETAMEPEGPEKYAPELEEKIAELQKALESEKYDDLRECLVRAAKFGRIATVPKTVDPYLKSRAQALRSQVKADLEQMLEKQLRSTEAEMLQILQGCAVSAGQLVALTDEFQRRYDAAKRRAGVVDFTDLEHMALQILVEEKDGILQPSPEAKEYASYFAEVMTDEYQDSNLVQETLLKSVSRENNRFMVGDVKQSIYRFRLARPELFMEKYDTYTQKKREDTATEPDGDGLIIELHKNFRSRAQVLEGTNMLFRQLMDRDLGGIAYDHHAALYPGAMFESCQDETVYQPELLLIGEGMEPGDPLHGDLVRQEAMCVGRRIKKMVGTFPVWDAKRGTYRMARYSDFVILLRTISGWGDVFAKVLSEMGIPAASGGGKGFFDTLEVEAVLSYLAILDNPRQDIPLTGALRLIGGFTDEELVQIRMCCKEGDFYDACMANINEESGRLRHFFETLAGLREESTCLSVHELIYRVLDETGFGNAAAALPGGSVRGENLRLLVERAVAFERSTSKGLFRFLRYVSALRAADVNFPEASAVGDDELVQIMSIHKSKGLEFPVVFVSGLGKQFNFMDSYAGVTLHPTLGIGCSYVDTKRRVKIPVTIHTILGEKLKEESLSEELRVLYVALTRAKEKLILTGTHKLRNKESTKKSKKEERYQNIALMKEQMLPYSLRKSAQNFCDLIVPAVLRHESCQAQLAAWDIIANTQTPVYRDGCGFLVKEINCREENELLASVEAQKGISSEELYALLATEPDKTYDPYVADRMQKLLAWEKEADQEEEDIPAKISVSFLKHFDYEPAQEGSRWFDADPSGSAKDKAACDDQNAEDESTGAASAGEQVKLTGADRGTLYHTVMEEYTFASPQFAEKSFLERELERMTSCGKIGKGMSASISEEDFLAFMKSETAERIHLAAASQKLHRETPFVLGKPARELRPGWDSEEMVLIQGVIDVWFEEEDEIVLLDYKTDRVRGDESLLKTYYHTQLELYAEALERLTGKRVREKLIYSFDLGRTVTIDI